MTELNQYRNIGTVEECKKAMQYFKSRNKQLHNDNENCKTCAKHGKCSTENYSCWCIWYKKVGVHND